VREFIGASHEGRNMKTIGIIKYTFTLVGIGALAVALWLYRDTSIFLGEATRAVGMVVDLERSQSSDSTTYSTVYRPVVRFTDGTGVEIKFTSSTGSNPPSYSRGERVEVLYLPSQPQKARINGFFSLWGLSLIFGGLGALFLAVGTGLTLVGALKTRRTEYLKKYGTPIETEFQSVVLNRALSVNGRHPFRVFTQWLNPSTSKVHVFESDDLWFDPSDYITDKRIRVFIDVSNPKRYYVDLSFLPKLTD
jgi:hypothetical protein